MTIIKTKSTRNTTESTKSSNRPITHSDRDKSVRSKKTAANTSTTKQAKIISLLQRQKGATIAELSKMTQWQEHSIRGFMSGTLKKRMGLNIISEKGSKGIRRYRIGNSKVETSAIASPSPDTGGQA